MSLSIQTFQIENSQMIILEEYGRVGKYIYD